MLQVSSLLPEAGSQAHHSLKLYGPQSGRVSWAGQEVLQDLVHNVHNAVFERQLHRTRHDRNQGLVLTKYRHPIITDPSAIKIKQSTKPNSFQTQPSTSLPRKKPQHSLSTTPTYLPSATLICSGHFLAALALSLTTLPCTSSNSLETSLAAAIPSAKFARAEPRRFAARAWSCASSWRREFRVPELCCC